VLHDVHSELEEQNPLAQLSHAWQPIVPSETYVPPETVEQSVHVTERSIFVVSPKFALHCVHTVVDEQYRHCVNKLGQVAHVYVGLVDVTAYPNAHDRHPLDAPVYPVAHVLQTDPSAQHVTQFSCIDTEEHAAQTCAETL